MAKRKNNRGGTIGFLAIWVVLAMLVLAIVGLYLNWVSYDGGYVSYTLIKLRLMGDAGDKFNAMYSFAILTVILTALTAVLAGICKVLHWKLFRLLLIIIAIVCVICGVLTIVMTYSYISALENIFVPAVGMWLTSIGGIIGGLIGTVAAVKN